MPINPNAKPSPAGARIEARMHARPLLTLSTVAAAVAIFSAIIPAGFWFFSHFQTSDAATSERIANARRDAWAAYSIKRIEVILVRNRVNECIAMKQSRAPLLAVQLAACHDYEVEFAESSRQLEKLRDEAMSFGKEK
jgi:hypothetical protein